MQIITRLATTMVLFALCACSNQDNSIINKLLDSRDQAVSNHDILAYHALLAADYDDGGQNEADLVIRMHNLFKQFDQISMQSNGRIIRKQDDRHALCEQNYILRVHADNNWRQISQREQIALTRTENGWRISGGL